MDPNVEYSGEGNKYGVAKSVTDVEEKSTPQSENVETESRGLFGFGVSPHNLRFLIRSSEWQYPSRRVLGVGSLPSLDFASPCCELPVMRPGPMGGFKEHAYVLGNPTD